MAKTEKEHKNAVIVSKWKKIWLFNVAYWFAKFIKTFADIISWYG